MWQLLKKCWHILCSSLNLRKKISSIDDFLRRFHFFVTKVWIAWFSEKSKKESIFEVTMAEGIFQLLREFLWLLEYSVAQKSRVNLGKSQIESLLGFLLYFSNLSHLENFGWYRVSAFLALIFENIHFLGLSNPDPPKLWRG